MARLYSLRKSLGILHKSFSLFEKKGKILGTDHYRWMEENLRELEKALVKKDVEKADRLARELEAFTQKHFKRNYFTYAFEMGVAILIALFIATLVRQVWFELYEIPTGSMRPSFREHDHLAVSKTAFGLNIPLQTKHFYFDPDLVRRGGVVIFSGDQLPMLDSDTTYFGVIPYKKRYIKRLIGKPGDTLYFYGGRIYGVDQNGKPIKELLNDSWMKQLEHIPFHTFEGRVTSAGGNWIVFHQMNQPIARLLFRPGTTRGEVFDGKQWVKEQPFLEIPHDHIVALGDFWGIKNYAKARLLTKKELTDFTNFDPEEIGEADLYLELRHSSNLTYPKPRLFKAGGGLGVDVSTFETVIPLKEKHIEAIANNLYTSRFVVQDGRVHRYGEKQGQKGGMNNFQFSDVPNGTYELYHGKGKKVSWKGLNSSLPEDHPLYDPKKVEPLFNLGIQMPSNYIPSIFFRGDYPHRYAYFRDGDLYVMGAPIIKKDDETLMRFVVMEKEKEKKAPSYQPYLAFIDHGPPLKENGDFDTEFIQKFGLSIPEGEYLVLGDNHAMSADSREFGFVPQANIQGVPVFLLWPPGGRWGLPPQTPYPFITLPRLIVWGIVLASLIIWYIQHRRKMKKRLFKD